MPDGQVGAFRVERRRQVQGQPAKLDLRIEPVGEGFGDALAQDLGRKRNSDDDRDCQDGEDSRNRGTDEPAPAS